MIVLLISIFKFKILILLFSFMGKFLQQRIHIKSIKFLIYSSKNIQKSVTRSINLSLTKPQLNDSLDEVRNPFLGHSPLPVLR